MVGTFFFLRYISEGGRESVLENKRIKSEIKNDKISSEEKEISYVISNCQRWTR